MGNGRDHADLVLFVQLYRKSTLSSGSRCPCQRRLRARRISRRSLMRKLPSRWFSSSTETSSRIGLWTELIRSSSGGTSITFETTVILSGSLRFTSGGIDCSNVKRPRALKLRSATCAPDLSLSHSSFISMLWVFYQTRPLASPSPLHDTTARNVATPREKAHIPYPRKERAPSTRFQLEYPMKSPGRTVIWITMLMNKFYALTPNKLARNRRSIPSISGHNTTDLLGQSV